MHTGYSGVKNKLITASVVPHVMIIIAIQITSHLQLVDRKLPNSHLCPAHSTVPGTLVCVALYTQMYSEHGSSHVEDRDYLDSAAHQERPMVEPEQDAVPSQSLEVTLHNTFSCILH